MSSLSGTKSVCTPCETGNEKQAYSVRLFSQKTSFSHQLEEEPAAELCTLLKLELGEYWERNGSTLDVKARSSADHPATLAGFEGGWKEGASFFHSSTFLLRGVYVDDGGTWREGRGGVHGWMITW